MRRHTAYQPHPLTRRHPLAPQPAARPRMLRATPPDWPGPAPPPGPFRAVSRPVSFQDARPANGKYVYSILNACGCRETTLSFPPIPTFFLATLSGALSVWGDAPARPSTPRHAAWTGNPQNHAWERNYRARNGQGQAIPVVSPASTVPSTPSLARLHPLSAPPPPPLWPTSTPSLPRLHPHGRPRLLSPPAERDHIRRKFIAFL